MAAKRFEALDGMRGVCALIVAVYHCDLALDTGHLLNHGWLAVDVFFVLSGFVIAYTYEERLKTGFTFGRFLRARGRRLVPVHVIGTACATLALVLTLAAGAFRYRGLGYSSLGLAGVLGALLIPVNLTPLRALFAPANMLFPTNPALWSLQCEWVANIVYARWLFTRSVRVLALLVVLLAVPLVMFSLTYRFGWSLGGRYNELLWGSGRATAEFLIGVLLSRLHGEGRFRSLPSLRPELVYALWFAVSCVPMPHVMPLFEAGASLVAAPILIALLVRSDRPVPRLFVWLGALSYPLYASHLTLINLAPLWLDPAVPRHSILYVFPMIAAALALAWSINRLIPGTAARQPAVAAPPVSPAEAAEQV